MSSIPAFRGDPGIGMVVEKEGLLWEGLSLSPMRQLLGSAITDGCCHVHPLFHRGIVFATTRQPGCTWLDDTEPSVPPARWPPRLAKSPKPVAGWRGQTKTPHAQGSRDLNLAFMAFRRGRGQFARLAARQEGNSWHSGGDGAQETPHRRIGHLIHRLLFGQGQSGTTMFGSGSCPPAPLVVCRAG